MRLPGKVVIVLDVLFATSTMCAALANGATCVIPTLDETAARAAGAQQPDDRFVLSGELHAETFAGFAPPTPLALLDHGVRDKRLILATTNGTVAVQDASAAEHLYVAALVNGAAVVERVLRDHPANTIVIVCSGSMGNFNLEDGYGAGYLVDLIAKSVGNGVDLSDAARATRALFGSGKPYDTLIECRVGKMMAARGLAHEVEYASRLSSLDVVPRLVEGTIRVA